MFSLLLISDLKGIIALSAYLVLGNQDSSPMKSDHNKQKHRIWTTFERKYGVETKILPQ
jgi:hypothetical protein